MPANINYTGSLLNPSGYGQANRTDVAALYLNRANIRTTLVSQMTESTDFGWMGKLAEQLSDNDVDYKIQIIHLTPDCYETHMEKKKYHIGRLFFETDRLPDGWPEACNKMDEIWTASEPQAEMIRNSGVTVPIHCFPQPIDMTYSNTQYQIKGFNGFKFYSVFQWIERKNPRALITTYWKTFENIGDVMLIIKTFGFNYSPQEFDRIRREIDEWKLAQPQAHYPKIFFIRDLMTTKQMMKLHATADCFVTTTAGEGYCTLPGSRVVTQDGQSLIEEADGKFVLTHLGNYKKAKVLSREYSGEMKVITPWLVRPITLTPNHRVLARRENRNQWVEAGDIRIDDFLCMPRIKDKFIDPQIDILKYFDSNKIFDLSGVIVPAGKNQFGTKMVNPKYRGVKRFIHLTPDLMYLFGLFIADGSASSKKGNVVFCLNDGTKLEAVSRIAETAKEIFGINPYISVMDRHRISVVLNSSILGKLFSELFGVGARQKHIPAWFMELDGIYLKPLLEGLVRGDGNICKNVVSYSTTSENLGWQVFSLMSKFTGRPGSMRIKKRKVGFEYVAKMRTDFIFPGKGFSDSEYNYFQIKKIESVQYSGSVFNLSVEDDESYVLQGVTVHNCIPVVEAMLSAKPVIGINKTGIFDLLTKDLYLPCATKLVPITKNPRIPYYDYPQNWLEIDREQLAKFMMFAYKNKTTAKILGEAGQLFVKKELNLWKVGKMMTNRLAEIERNL